MSDAAPVPARLVPVPRDTLPAGAFRQEVAIRFSHCDPAGIVYFARYFDILNGVVEDWFPARLGFPYGEFIRRRRIGLGYASVQADFARTSEMGDVLTIVPLVERIGTASLPLVFHAYRGEEPILAARMTIVTTSLDERRAIPIPEDLRAALARYQESCR